VVFLKTAAIDCQQMLDTSLYPASQVCRRVSSSLSRLRQVGPSYGVGVDVKRAADLYAQGRSLREIGAELGVHWSTVSEQLQRAGFPMRRGGPPAHPASIQEILELRERGLTWREVAEQVNMTVSGVWSRNRRTRPRKPARLGRWPT